MMVAVGVQLGRPEAPKNKRGVRLMAKAIVLNVVIVPALAFAVTRTLHASGDVTIALLILSVAPGAAFVPDLVGVAGAELGFAVELMLLLAKITCFTAPPMARWLLSVHHFHFAELPFLLKLVLLQMAPLLLAKWLRRRNQRIEELYLPARWTAVCSAVILFGLVAVKGGVRGLLYLGDRGWVAVIIVAAGSAALGWLLAGPRSSDRTSVAVTINAKSLALSLVLATDVSPRPTLQVALLGAFLVLTLVSLALAWLARRKSHEPFRSGRSFTW